MPSASAPRSRKSTLGAAAAEAARPLVGVTTAAVLTWDEASVVRGAAGGCVAVFGRTALELKGKKLAQLFDRPETLGDALTFGVARPVRSVGGELYRVEAGPCPDGAIAIVRRQTAEELDLARLVASLGHELRNAFASVLLAVQSLERQGEVESERGKRRLQLAERELRRIECVLRGLQEVGKSQVARTAAVNPVRLVEQALAPLGEEIAEAQLRLSTPNAGDELVLLDGARVRLAIEEMARRAVRAAPRTGAIAVRIEPRALDLAISVCGPLAAPRPDVPDEDEREAELALAVVEGVARSHGGHVERRFNAEEEELTLVLPRRMAT